MKPIHHLEWVEALNNLSSLLSLSLFWRVGGWGNSNFFFFWGGGIFENKKTIHGVGWLGQTPLYKVYQTLLKGWVCQEWNLFTFVTFFIFRVFGPTLLEWLCASPSYTESIVHGYVTQVGIEHSTHSNHKNFFTWCVILHLSFNYVNLWLLSALTLHP